MISTKKHLNSLQNLLITIFIILHLDPMILCLKPAENYISIPLSAQKQKEVKVNVVTDDAMLKPKIESVEKWFSMFH